MPLFALVNAVCLGLVAILLITAAVQDLRTMTIGNGLSLGIAGLFAVWSLAAISADRLPTLTLAWSVGGGIAVLAAGAVAFAVGLLGGGDVKLLAAMSLFAGPSRLLDSLTITALAGGLLGLAILAGAPIGRSLATCDGETLRARLRRGLPYGPAIAAGGLWVAASLVLE
jgi:prepilin peptidase CpaA